MPKVSFLLALGFFIFSVYTSAISPPRFARSWISVTYFFFKRSKQEKFGISFYPQAARFTKCRPTPPQACFIALLPRRSTGP